MLTNIALLALAGTAGTLARYGVGLATLRLVSAGAAQPAATFAVNMAGSFAFGLIMGVAARGGISEQARLALLTGFMGAFTTFSTLAWDTGAMLEGGRPGLAALNIVGSAACGVALALLGVWLAR